MLTAQSEKQLSGEWQRDRERALKDSSSFTSAELTDLGVTIEGLGINDPDIYRIYNTPVDANTSAKRNVNIKTRPECGD